MYSHIFEASQPTSCIARFINLQSCWSMQSSMQGAYYATVRVPKIFLPSPPCFLMICSNRKTRVFDLSGHETWIAYVSLIKQTSRPAVAALLSGYTFANAENSIWAMQASILWTVCFSAIHLVTYMDRKEWWWIFVHCTLEITDRGLLWSLTTTNGFYWAPPSPPNSEFYHRLEVGLNRKIDI